MKLAVANSCKYVTGTSSEAEESNSAGLLYRPCSRQDKIFAANFLAHDLFSKDEKLFDQPLLQTHVDWFVVKNFREIAHCISEKNNF